MTDPHSKARLRPVIRVFVSSTFSDMRYERDALQEDVFPKLEEFCQKNGFQFQAIDLRWGVSTEAGLDHRAMRICFEELRRAQDISPEPNFLVLLGNRYGWRPLPEEISHAEFTRLATASKSGGEGSSPVPGTHGKTAHQVLSEWYRCDENVLLQVPPETDPDRVPLNYILQPRTQDLGNGRDYTRTTDDPPRDTPDWIDVQQVLWRIINTAFPAESLQHRFEGIDWTEHVAEVNDPHHPRRAVPQLVRFQASATEQEIWSGALSALNAERHVLAFFREITNRDEFAAADVKDFFDRTDAGEFDEAAAARQTALKEAIRLRLGNDAPVPIPFSRLTRENGRIVVASSEEDRLQFCASVETRLRSIIEPQIDQYWKKTTPASPGRAARELEIEQQEHAIIVQERGGAEAFVGRDDKLEAIRKYLHNDSTWPLVVYGASGCGKTALLAMAAQEAGFGGPPGGSASGPVAVDTDVRPPDDTNSAVIVRFIGTTPRSSNLRGLLSSLCQELRLRWPREGELPTDIKLLEVELQEQITKATHERPLILFLDALDQLADTDGGRWLHWIPTGPLPPHVKLVVSCLSDRAKDDPTGQPYAELKRRKLSANQFINLDALSETEARTLLFDRWLRQARRTVSPNQRVRIEKRLASASCRQPIYLKLLFEEARLWRSYDSTPDLGESVPALLAQLFERLGQPTNHGQLLVERVLGYLAASREGLAENEILEILFRDPDYKKVLDNATEATRHEMPTNATRIPIAIWSRLHFDLASYLTERAATGANVLTFYHRQVAEWVQEHFAKVPDKRWQPHPLLADYFRDLGDPERNQSWKSDNPRPFLQMVFHLVEGERVDEYCQILCDLRFVEARCRNGQVFELIADYRLAKENLPEEQVDLLEERARGERERRWTAEIIEYARQWSDRRDQLDRGEAVTELEPKLPESPFISLMLIDGEVQAKFPRIIEKPKRIDKLKAFSSFVSGQCYSLLKHARHPGFVLQQSYNDAPSGPVHNAAVTKIAALTTPLILRRWVNDQKYDHKTVLLRTLEGHSNAVKSVSVTPNGRRVVSGSADHTLRVWDVENGECLHTLNILEGNGLIVSSVSISPDGRFAVSDSENVKVRVWDLINGECLRTLEGHDHTVTSVSMTPDGRRAVSGSGDRTLRVWDLERGECSHVLKGHDHTVTSVSMTPDGRRAVSGSDDRTLRVWDLESGGCSHVLKGHDHTVTSVSMTADGRLTVSGSADQTLRVWDLESGQCLHVFEGHSNIVKSVSLTMDGRLVVSGGYDDTLRMWNMENRCCLCTIIGHSGRIDSVSVTADGRRVVSGGYDDTVRVWDVESGQWMERHRDKVEIMSVTPDNRRAVSRSVNPASWSMEYDISKCRSDLQVWDLESGQCLQVLEGHSDIIQSVSIKPDSRIAVSGGEDKTLRVWDLESGRCLRILESCNRILCVKVTPDGQRAMSGDYTGSINHWDLESGRCLYVLKAHSSTVSCLSMTPDGRRAVSGSDDRTLRVLDLKSGNCLHLLKGHTYGVSCMSVTPDGQRVVSGSGDHTLRVWDIERGRCLHVLEGHRKRVYLVSVTPDGRRAVSGSEDKTLRVWDLERGQCLHILEGHRNEVSCVNIMPDGLYAMSLGLYDKVLYVWDLETGQYEGVFSLMEHINIVMLKKAGVLAMTDTGELLPLELRNFPVAGAAILTAHRLSQCTTQDSLRYTAYCPVCFNEFTPSTDIISAIDELKVNNDYSESASLLPTATNFADRRLLYSCPYCAQPLKFNPFFVSTDTNDTTYELYLRQGLEQCRRSKSDYEGTLGHLAALVVHLEKMGKSIEALDCSRLALNVAEDRYALDPESFEAGWSLAVCLKEIGDLIRGPSLSGGFLRRLIGGINGFRKTYEAFQYYMRAFEILRNLADGGRLPDEGRFLYEWLRKILKR